MVAAVGVVPRDRALRAVQVMDGFGVAFGRALVVSNGIAKGKKADPEQQEPGHHAQFVRRHGSRSRLSVSRDRKSTRLNSSHVEISYAVFCLKKKKGASSSVRSLREVGGGTWLC